MAFDSEQSRAPYLHLVEELRSAILSGEYAAGDRLPSRHELAATHKLALATVQRALSTLANEGLIVSQPGRGTFVREPASSRIGLAPAIERAFQQQHVTIDFVGTQGESLNDAMREQLSKVHLGQLTPESIKIRMLLPDYAYPLGLPATINGLADSPEFRSYALGEVERHAVSIMHSVNQLVSRGIIAEASAEIRVFRTTPLFTLFLINSTEKFFGYYPVRQEVLPLSTEPIAVYDIMSKDVTLFHYSTNSGNSMESRLIRQATDWFDNMWNTIAFPFRSQQRKP